jgi:hypothetical protein
LTKLPAPYVEKPCEELFYKMKKIEGLSYSIHLLKQKWAGKKLDKPTEYDALELQNLRTQRQELWGLLPPLRKVVDNT